MLRQDTALQTERTAWGKPWRQVTTRCGCELAVVLVWDKRDSKGKTDWPNCGDLPNKGELLTNPGTVFTLYNSCWILLTWQLVFHHPDPKSLSAVLRVTLSPSSIGCCFWFVYSKSQFGFYSFFLLLRNLSCPGIIHSHSPSPVFDKISSSWPILPRSLNTFPDAVDLLNSSLPSGDLEREAPESETLVEPPAPFWLWCPCL